MSVPAWKQAIIARKKQQEEAEKKKQLEKEQYLQSLPPWKRAMMLAKKKEELGSATKQESPLVKPKMEKKALQKQARCENESFEKDETQAKDSNKTVEKTSSSDEKVSSADRRFSITQSMKGKFEQQPKPQAAFQTTSSTKTVEKQSQQKQQLSSTTAAVPDPVDNKTNGIDEKASQVPFTSKPRPSLMKAQTVSVDIDDEKFKSMPKWKQELILRKKKKASPSTDRKNRPESPLAKSPPKSSWSPPSQRSQLEKSEPESQSESKDNALPEVVNASDKQEPDSPKLLHKEGKELKPPVFKVKNRWADVTEDDPEFKGLPEWKRTLILRRKNDIKVRTAPPKEEKKEKPKEEKNEPLPTNPLWTPTRSVTVREIPKEPVEEEEVNPFLKMRENLRKVSSKRESAKTEEDLSKDFKKVSALSSSQLHSTINEDLEADETVSPLEDLSQAKKPQKKKLRRVSWSDTDLNQNLTVEFTYPKYSYEDYHEIDHDAKEEKQQNEEDTDDGLATPLHPWLSSNSTSSPSKSMSSSGSSFGSPTSFGMSSMGGLGSLGSFMSAYTSGTASSSPSSFSSSSNSISSSNKQKNEETIKSNPILDNDEEEDTAALIW